MKLTKLRGMRYFIWLYFILYTVIIILAMWFFQIVFLDSFYQRIRFNNLKKTGNELAEKMTCEKVTNELVDEWINKTISANSSGIYTYLVYNNDKGQRVIESPYSYFLPGGNPPTTNGPEYIKNSSVFDDAIKRLNSGAELQDGCLCDYYSGTDDKTQFCVYAKNVSNELGEFCLFLISDKKSLNETLTVVQYQLIIVTVAVVILSFFLAWTISTKLSDPIRKMSETAKQWAESDNSIVFKGESYEELNELADALNYAKEGVSKAGSLQRDLLANVSHDLKTPLTMIKAYAEMIRDISGDNKQKRTAHTEVIIEEADRLTMLVNDILDLSKLQNNTNAIELQQVDLSELVERVIYRFNDFISAKGYIIESHIEPEAFTECDEKKIEQVVYNLIGNSINYTGEDKTVKVFLTKKDDDCILLEIMDSGKGIPAEQIDTIWEKYYRFSETHQRPVKGTGLGLSIVKTILENHKLRFGVISKKGCGSNFFVEFKGLKDDRQNK